MAKPVNFVEANKHLGAGRGHNKALGEIAGLPVWTDNIQVISRWKLTMRERLNVLITGKVWVCVGSGGTCPPIAVDGMVNMFSSERAR